MADVEIKVLADTEQAQKSLDEVKQKAEELKQDLEQGGSETGSSSSSNGSSSGGKTSVGDIKEGEAKKSGEKIGKYAGVAMAIYAALGLKRQLEDWSLDLQKDPLSSNTEIEKEQIRRSAQDKWSDQFMKTGAAGGAAIGTVIAPGIGTAIGAAAGGIAGKIAGFFLGDYLGKVEAEKMAVDRSVTATHNRGENLTLRRQTIGASFGDQAFNMMLQQTEGSKKLELIQNRKKALQEAPDTGINALNAELSRLEKQQKTDSPQYQRLLKQLEMQQSRVDELSQQEFSLKNSFISTFTEGATLNDSLAQQGIQVGNQVNVSDINDKAYEQMTAMRDHLAKIAENTTNLKEAQRMQADGSLRPTSDARF